MSDRTERAQRIGRLRDALREHLGEEDDAVAVVIANPDGTITATDLTDDYVHEHRATFMLPPSEDLLDE